MNQDEHNILKELREDNTNYHKNLVKFKDLVYKYVDWLNDFDVKGNIEDYNYIVDYLDRMAIDFTKVITEFEEENS